MSMLLRLVAVVAAAQILSVQAEIHAVLVAGSKGWQNYRHQADIAHAYTLLTSGGVKKDNIITFMYDDIAGAFQNHFKGQLFNRPSNSSSAPSPDVYAAVKGNIDYTHSEVSPSNFLAVLSGNKPSGGTGRTLSSTAQDDVFVYFADHGGVGSLAFPGFLTMRTLGADKINAAIQEAHSKKLYKRLVFYTEACESGSIFDGLLPSNISAYAVTAANGKESSWGWYCDGSTGGNEVNGKSMGVCLGDEFSVRWLEDADASDRSAETLTQQYQKMLKRVTKSHPQHFGDLAVGSDQLGDYVGEGNSTIPLPEEPITATRGSGAVSSRDAMLKMLEFQLEQAKLGDPRFNLTQAIAELDAELEHRKYSDDVFSELYRRFHPGLELEAMQYKPPRNFRCLETANRVVESTIGYSDYSLKFSAVLSNLCESGHSSDDIEVALRQIIEQVH